MWKWIQESSTAGSTFGRRYLVNTLVAIVIPLITGFVGKISALDQVFLGLFVFIVGLLIQLTADVAATKRETLRHIDLWKIQGETDRLLNNVRADYARLIERDNFLYTRYFDRELLRISDDISRAQTSGQLSIDQDSDTTEIMLRDFAGRDGETIRAVHYLRDNQFLFDVHASHFFCDVADLVRRGLVKGVRRLMVIDEDYQVEDDQTRRLLAFHEGTDGFDYRIIRKGDLDRIKRDFKLPTDTKDFGVYAASYVYRSVVAADQEVKGIFSTDAETIRRFMGAFDRAWKSDISFKSSTHIEPAPTLRMLFGHDPVSPNRPGITQISSGARPMRITGPVPGNLPPSGNSGEE